MSKVPLTCIAKESAKTIAIDFIELMVKDDFLRGIFSLLGMVAIFGGIGITAALIIWFIQTFPDASRMIACVILGFCGLALLCCFVLFAYYSVRATMHYLGVVVRASEQTCIERYSHGQ